MRLIDADALLDYLEEDPPYNWTNSDAEIQSVADWEQFKGMINVQPTITNVEDVVHCKDCRKFKTYACRMVASGYDDFCSYGERKDG